MKRLLLIGTIDETHENVSGQYDRTEIIKDGLQGIGYSVQFLNMMNWKKKPLSLLASIRRGYFETDSTIFLASLNGTRVILNVLSLLRLFAKKPAYQIVIGGQSNYRFIEESIKYRKRVASLSAVFVEVESMIDDYNSIGIDNVFYLPNCKSINIIPEVVEKPRLDEPYRFCTYSRVTPEKGIAEAIAVVEDLNREFGHRYCTLDIYGTYVKEDRLWFEKLMEQTSDAVTYKGRIERKESIDVLSQYDLMLFPTQHTGEGVPGGIIDCYEAGLPVVTCNTSYMSKIVIDGITGYVYDRGNQPALMYVVKKYATNLTKTERRNLRNNCQKEAIKYDTSSVIKTLSAYIDNNK